MGAWYLVRHGETSWNRSGRIQGHTDAPLDEHGRRQMTVLARRLGGCNFSAMYASDLSRATESAETIVVGRRSSLETDSDLREFSYGEWEGLTVKEIEARYPEVLAQRMGLGHNAFAAPGGEDSAQVLDRVRRFYASAVKRHDDSENILIVAHGGPLRALLICLLGLTDDYFWRFQIDCASLSIIGNHPNGRVLELLNDTGHLTTVARGAEHEQATNLDSGRRSIRKEQPRSTAGDQR